MPKKKLFTKSNKQKLIDELDADKSNSVKSEFVVGKKVIVDKQPIQQITVDKQQRLREHAETVLKPYQFTPGESGNPHGRPKDIVKEIGRRIARTKVGKVLSTKERKFAADLDIKPDDMTILQNIMLELSMSRNPQKIELFLDRTFGKVPNININAEISASLVARYRTKFTDAELEQIASGEDALDILMQKIPDVIEGDIVEQGE